MGMALAHRLAKDGERVTVIEAGPQLGGLATWHDFGGFDWDRFYHVILPTDRYLIRFMQEIGLGDHLEWRRTYTGFFVDGKVYSLSSNLEFLRFPLLSLISKARLAWTMLYCSRIDDWRRLETQTAEEFLLRVSGSETYEKLWKPLLLAKLGENYRRVSAVFIWSYIKRLFSARDKSASAEHLGHVSGGYKMVFDRLQQTVLSAGGDIRTGTSVTAVRPSEGGRLAVEVEKQAEHFDHVICTSPVSVLRKLVQRDLLDVLAEGRDVEYLGVVCPVLVSRKAIVPYYVVNIADREIPFTGMIGMSTVIDPKNTGGRYLTYLPKYVLSTDPHLQRTDEDVKEEFMAGVRRMLPDFDSERIESIHVNRAVKVQPLQVLNYSSLVPSVRTRHPGLFVLNTSQFVNATLNNNEVIGAVNRFYADYRLMLERRTA
jgi:protoporphyrinogen oxidase